MPRRDDLPRGADRRPPGGRALLLAAVALLSGPASLGQATTIEPRRLPELVSAADRISLVRVVESRTRRDSAGLIWTDHVLELQRELRAPGLRQGSVFELSQVGGCVGERCLELVGQPRLEVGQEWILFTEQRALGRAIVHGPQGALPVERTATGARCPGAMRRVPGIGSEVLDDVLLQLAAFAASRGAP